MAGSSITWRLRFMVSRALMGSWGPSRSSSVVHGPNGSPYPTSEYEHSSIPATVKKLFNLSSPFLTKRDAWAGTFEGIVQKLAEPRTDCPEKLPTPVKIREAEAKEEAKLSEFQQEMLQLAAVLKGDNIFTSYPEKLGKDMTVKEVIICVTGGEVTPSAPLGGGGRELMFNIDHETERSRRGACLPESWRQLVRGIAPSVVSWLTDAGGVEEEIASVRRMEEDLQLIEGHIASNEDILHNTWTIWVGNSAQIKLIREHLAGFNGEVRPSTWLSPARTRSLQLQIDQLQAHFAPNQPQNQHHYAQHASTVQVKAEQPTRAPTAQVKAEQPTRDPTVQFYDRKNPELWFAWDA
ncbi:hypothetical protein CRG98_021836 [Punica granatum]|uniref:Uncharacterized protein n=1 Tax=Punica granatum TaxID=22663 RepID=A0A2I0JND5_PUNGR|nr:hypothetical protein CRG98_021836 [Punica granatum]